MMDCSNFHGSFQGGEGVKVLLVDKDPNSLWYMSRILEEHSYEVVTTKLASVALSLILERGNKFDLIITEIEMPGINGFELLKQISSIVDTPTLLISTSEDRELMKKALNEGASFFFHKPIARHNLVNIWQHVLRYRLEKNQLNKGVIPREIGIFFEDFHRKRKYPFLDSHEMKNYGITSPSVVSIDFQSHARNENHNDGSSQLWKRARNSSSSGTSGSSGSSGLGLEKQNEEKHRKRNPRLYWNPELQQKFKDVYDALGDDRATPSKIKQLLNEPQVTTQHISSYLQKFRAKIKAQREKTTNPFFKPQRCLGTYPSCMQSSKQLNISRPNYFQIQPHGDQMQNVGTGPNYHNIQTNEHPTHISNSMTNTSNIVSDNFCPGIRGNIVDEMQPHEPMLATGIIDYWQEHIEAPKMINFQSNIHGLGMPWDNIPASEVNEDCQVQQQNVCLGVEGGNIDMAQELVPAGEVDIDDMLKHFPDVDSNKHESSPEGNNGSACSVTKPLTPQIGASPRQDDFTQTSKVVLFDDALEMFLTQLEHEDNQIVLPI